jgi:hypothetical protein
MDSIDECRWYPKISFITADGKLGFADGGAHQATDVSDRLLSATLCDVEGESACPNPEPEGYLYYRSDPVEIVTQHAIYPTPSMPSDATSLLSNSTTCGIVTDISPLTDDTIPGISRKKAEVLTDDKIPGISRISTAPYRNGTTERISSPY